jgi:hypothetical protein
MKDLILRSRAQRGVSKDGSRHGRSKRPSFETAAQEGGLLRMRPSFFHTLVRGA